MRLEDVKVGYHKVGPFTIIVSRPVYRKETDEELNFFEVFVHQDDPNIDKMIYYVHLVNDERFDHFKHLRDFSRLITEEDVVEFNSHVSTVFHELSMPTFKLSRRSIVALFDKCQTLAKKIKKQQKQGNKNE